MTKGIEREVIAHQVEYVNFPDDNAQIIAGILESTGLPVTGFDKVKYDDDPDVRPGLLGSCNFSYRELVFTKNLDLEQYPHANSWAQVILGTAVHEQAHSILVSDLEDDKKQQILEMADRIAIQTHLTEKYLNSYHRQLHKEYKAAYFAHKRREITDAQWNAAQDKWIIENHAIVSEVRYTNPTHLAEVSKEQVHDLAKNPQKRTREVIVSGMFKNREQLVSDIINSPADLTKAADSMILLAIQNPDIQTRQQLDEHIKALREKVRNDNNFTSVAQSH